MMCSIQAKMYINSTHIALEVHDIFINLADYQNQCKCKVEEWNEYRESMN